MQNVLHKNQRLLFYSGWFLLNIIQAATTELLDDEAYYWVYSRFLDWGYFDHPPMVAALIKAGYALFHNELGVRLLFVALNTATICIIQELTAKKDERLFYAIAGSVAIAQIGGILAAPDIPLLFFTALFFLLFRHFIQRMNFINTLLLGICMALMLYSKYHGVLIIFFAFISSIRLLTKWQVYAAGLVCLLLVAPHLYWQYTHNFPSVQYHLFERNASHYKFSYTLEYIIGQIAMAGPLVGWLLLWAAYRHKPITVTEKAMQYTFLGIYFVFLVSTLKGRVEANWTVAAFIPMMVLSHQYLVNRLRMRSWLFKSLPITLVLVLIGRVYVTRWVPDLPGAKRTEFHNNQVWADSMRAKTQGLPLVLINSYQWASKYMFYGGQTAFSLNTPYYRRNNFNVWPIEDSLIGKPVYLVVPQDHDFYKDVFGNQQWNFPNGGRVDHFYSFSRVLFTDITSHILQNRTLQLKTKVTCPEDYAALFRQPPYAQTPIWLALYRNNDIVAFINTGASVNSLTGNNLQLTINISYDFKPGEYSARLCIGSCVEGFPSINSTEFAFTVY
jgi:4-amino-4-deoxy-L-arabinose transferase and related glycosyltransferases of PMT family